MGSSAAGALRYAMQPFTGSNGEPSRRDPSMALRVSWLVMASLPLALLAGCAHGTSLRTEPRSPLESLTPAQRLDAIRRAQVWAPTDIPALDLLVGPQGEGAFALGETVTCDHHEKKLTGG